MCSCLSVCVAGSGPLELELLVIMMWVLEITSCTTGWLQTHYIAENDFELLILLAVPPEC